MVKSLFNFCFLFFITKVEYRKISHNSIASFTLTSITNGSTERVQKGIAYWDKQNNDVPASNYILKVQGEIIKVEGL